MPQRFLLPLLSILVLCFPGCGDPEWHLDRIAEDLEEYGSVTISGATLIEPDPRFMFDLNLTGEQLINRNRIEGFSNIYEAEALDLQVSVRAEIIQNMMGQLQGATEPKLMEQLRNAMMAAAFKGLMGNLPEADKAKFEDMLAPIGNVLGQFPGAGGPGGVGGISESDAGEGPALQAGLDSTNAEVVYNNVAKSKGTLKEDVEKDKEAVALIQDNANTFLHHIRSEVSNANEAARRAESFAHLVESQAALAGQMPAGIGGTLDEAIAKAQETMGLAVKLENNLKDTESKVVELIKKEPEEKKNEWVNKVLAALDVTMKPAPSAAPASTNTQPDGTAAPAPPDPTPTNVAACALASARAAKAAGGAVGVVARSPRIPTANAPQKIFEVPDLPAEEKRLALKRAKEFGAPLANPTGPFNMNMEQLLTLAGSEHQLLNMLKWNSYPTNYGPGNRVYLGMASVNVVPGRKTYEGYMGQVDVYMQYGIMDEVNKHLAEWDRTIEPIKGSARPTALAVFPLVNAQGLDLRSSQRQLFTMAMELMVSGYPVAAHALLDHMKQFEQDALTITALNTLSSYGNGSHIGFTFSPNYQAQKQLDKPNAKPGQRLQPWSFPIIVLIACDERMFSENSKIQLPTACLDEINGKANCYATQMNSVISRSVKTADDLLHVTDLIVTLSPQTFEQQQAAAIKLPMTTRPTTEPVNLVTPIRQYVRDLQAIEQKYFPSINDGPDGKAVDLPKYIELENDIVRGISTIIGALAETWKKRETERVFEKETVFKYLQGRIEAYLAQIAEHAVVLPTINQGPRYILWNQNHRWMRTDDRFDWLRRSRPSEYHRLQALHSLAGTIGERHPEKCPVDELLDYENKVDNRYRYIADMQYGTTIPLRLPVFDRSTRYPEVLDKNLLVEPAVGWVNRDSTFLVSHPNRPFTGDYLVSVGGKRVNAVKLSNGTLRVTMPPWLDTLNLEMAQALQRGDAKDERFTADLVVTDGNNIYKKSIAFKYYAPTPEISKLQDPGVYLNVELPKAFLIPGELNIALNKPIDFVVGLSRPATGVLSASMKVAFPGGSSNTFDIELQPETPTRLIVKPTDALLNNLKLVAGMTTSNMQLSIKRQDQQFTVAVEGKLSVILTGKFDQDYVVKLLASTGPNISITLDPELANLSSGILKIFYGAAKPVEVPLPTVTNKKLTGTLPPASFATFKDLTPSKIEAIVKTGTEERTAIVEGQLKVDGKISAKLDGVPTGLKATGTTAVPVSISLDLEPGITTWKLKSTFPAKSVEIDLSWDATKKKLTGNLTPEKFATLGGQTSTKLEIVAGDLTVQVEGGQITVEP